MEAPVGIHEGTFLGWEIRGYPEDPFGAGCWPVLGESSFFLFRERK